RLCRPGERVRRAVVLHALALLTATARADRYERQAGIDVLHYDLAVELADPPTSIRATARVDVRIRSVQLSPLWLAVEGMDIKGVRVGDAERAYERRGARLDVDLGRPYREGEIAAIEVRYQGNVRDRGLLAAKNKHGRSVIFAENWPDRAHHWFPSID